MGKWFKIFLASPANVQGIEKLVFSLGAAIAAALPLTGTVRILALISAGIAFAAGFVDIVRPDLAATVANLETDSAQTAKDAFSEVLSKSPAGAATLLNDLFKIGADASPIFATTATAPAGVTNSGKG